MAQPQLNADEIRRAILKRCTAYCEATGTGMTILSIALTNSPAYLGFLAGGRRNITLDMAEKIQTRLTALERTMEKLTYGKARDAGYGLKASGKRHRDAGAAVY